MAEIEIGVLAQQCLDRRIPDQEALRREVAAWQDQRNRDMARVDWRFTTADARIKLKSLYPAIQNRWTTRDCRRGRHSRRSRWVITGSKVKGAPVAYSRAIHLDSSFRIRARPSVGVLSCRKEMAELFQYEGLAAMGG